MPGRTQSSNVGGYRYAHNGQEKDAEIFDGVLTAEFWEYDARIGRRWEVDPLTNPWQSPYDCFNDKFIKTKIPFLQFYMISKTPCLDFIIFFLVY